jgi:hypothetical protein
MENVEVFHDHSVFYCDFGVHMSWPFDISVAIQVHFCVLVCCTKKNLATLI